MMEEIYNTNMFRHDPDARYCRTHGDVQGGLECRSCYDGLRLHVPATHTSANPDYQGYALCATCAAEYDARNPGKD